MQAHREDTVVDESGTIQLVGLPFTPGSPVEVIVLESSLRAEAEAPALRGSVRSYEGPFDPADEEAWDASA